MMSRSCVARSIVTPESRMRGRQRPDARGVGPEDAADPALARSSVAQLADRRVEALDVADHQLAPDARAAVAAMRSASARRVAIGFSTSTCLPASSAARPISRVHARTGAAIADGVDVGAAPSRARQSACQSIGRRPMRLRAIDSAGSATATTQPAGMLLPRLEVEARPSGPTPITPTLSSAPLTATSSTTLGQLLDGQRGDAPAACPSPKTGGRSSGSGSARAAAKRSGSTPTSVVPAGRRRSRSTPSPRAASRSARPRGRPRAGRRRSPWRSPAAPRSRASMRV